METMTISQASLWWNKLGKWRALAVILTLAVFFITLHFTGDKGKSFVFAAAVTALAVFTTALAPISAPSLAAFAAFTTALAAVATALAAFALVVAVTAFAALTAVVTAFAALFIAFAAFATFVANKKYGIRNRVAGLSLVAEFIVILFPMLLT